MGLSPTHVATPGVYALVGMGTAFAGIVRAPMTSVVMIFETTRDYAVIVPLMISNLVSFFISSKLQPDPIYEGLAHQDGIHLPSGDSRDMEDAAAGGEGDAGRGCDFVVRDDREGCAGEGEDQRGACLAGQR